MKPLKLQLNKKPKDFLEGEYIHAKNMVFNEYLSSVVNENGFTNNISIQTAINLIRPNTALTFLGFIEVNPNKAALFLSGISSAVTYEFIVLYNLETEVSTVIYAKEFQYSFQWDTYIRGTYFKNALNNDIVVFTDKTNPPYTYNLSDVDTSNLTTQIIFANYLLFKNVNQYILGNVSILDSGSLTSGTYFLFFNYETFDNSPTNYFQIGRPIYITGTETFFTDGKSIESNTLTNKSIQFDITNVDTNYSYLNLYAVKIQNQITKAYFVKKYTISSNSVDITYTGTEIESEIAVDTLLTIYPSYSHINEFEVFNNQLLGANVKKNIDYINYADTTNIHLKYTLRYFTDSGADNSINQISLGFGEVYAFYVSYKLIDGTYTDAFHIPGNILPGIALTPNVTIDATLPRYVYEDYCDNTGEFGGWYNDNETYGSYATYLTGINSNDKVRHFKTPSLKFITQDQITNNPVNSLQLMSVKIPVLGLKVTSITNPDPINIVGFKIMYAKKDSNNLLNYATGDYWLSGKHDGGGIVPNLPITDLINLGYTGYLNEFDRQNISRIITYDVNKSNIFFNSPVTQILNPSLNQDLIFSPQYNLAIGTVGTTVGGELEYLGGYNGNSTNENPRRRFLADFAGEFGSELDYLFAESNSPIYLKSIVPSNVITTVGSYTIRNDFNFQCRFFQIDEVALDAFLTANYCDVNMQQDPSLSLKGSFLMVASLINKKTDFFSNFQNQDILPVTRDFSFSELSINYTTLNYEYGDHYLGKFTYLTSTSSISQMASFNNLEDDKKDYGVRQIKAYITISPININGIHENKTIIGGVLYKEAPFQQTRVTSTNSKLGLIYPTSSFDLVTDIRWDEAGNKYTFNQDYSSKGALVNNISTYILNTNTLLEYPFRILKFNPITSEGNSSSYRTLLANNYFDINKTKGEIIKLLAEGSEKLIIHTTESLFKTRSYGQIQTGITAATVGTGDLFAYPPEEIIPNKYGLAGLQANDYYSARITPFGYFFLDSNNRIPYLVTDKPNAIYEDLFTFFRDNISNTNSSTSGYDKQNKRILLTFTDNSSTSYTLSYYPQENAWKSFHDYKPNYYITTKDKLIALDFTNDITSSNLAIFNVNYDTSNKGRFTKTIPYPSFIDAVVTTKEVELLNSIQWFSVNNFDIISIRNTDQHTGEIILNKFPTISNFHNARNNERRTNFNFIRDNTITSPFIYNIDQDYNPITSSFGNKSWHQTKTLIDNYFIIRFKVINRPNNEVVLTDVFINEIDSIR